MKYIFLILLWFSALACKHRETEKVKISEAIIAPPGQNRDVAVESSPPVQKELEAAPPGKLDVTAPLSAQSVSSVTKKIIKEGEISFETDNLQNTRKKLIKDLTHWGGYVDEENETNNTDENRKEIVLKTRVPAQNFEAFLNDISATASHIESKTIRVQDVTTRYIDITTRLNNKKLLEDRYKVLLQKATRMADVLQVEDKLNDIRTDIESTQGELNYLNKQIAYSSLGLTFYTKTIQGKEEGSGFGYELKTSLNEGWHKLQDFFFGLISLWPFLLIIILFALLFRRWRKKRRLNKN